MNVHLLGPFFSCAQRVFQLRIRVSCALVALEDMVHGGKGDAADSFKIYVVFNNCLMYLVQSNRPSKDHMRASCYSLMWQLYKTGICSSKNINHLTSVLFSIIPWLWWKERRCCVWVVLFVLLPYCHSTNKDVVCHSGKDFIWNHFSVLLFLALFLLLIFHHLLLMLCCLSPSVSSSSLARSVSSFECLCVNYDTCAVVVLNFCHQCH